MKEDKLLKNKINGIQIKECRLYATESIREYPDEIIRQRTISFISRSIEIDLNNAKDSKSI